MAITYYVTPVRVRELNRRVEFEGSAETITYDYTSWAEDNSNVTTVTWTLDSGDAAISGQALSSNVASALITTANSGTSLIKIAATDGTNINVQWLEIRAKSMDIVQSDDYGLVTA